MLSCAQAFPPAQGLDHPHAGVIGRLSFRHPTQHIHTPPSLPPPSVPNNPLQALVRCKQAMAKADVLRNKREEERKEQKRKELASKMEALEERNRITVGEEGWWCWVR